MSNRFYILLFLVGSAFLYPSIALHSQESEEIVLRWEEAPGSLGYVIEVRDSSNKVLDSKRLNATSYELNNYEPGIYEHRVGVINKFGKVENFTEWSKFEVVRTKSPIIRSQKVFSAGLEEATKKIEIQGKDFLPSMKIYLNKEGRRIQPISYEVKSDSTVVAEFRVEDMNDVGMYDIILENPKEKKAIKTKNFVLGRTKEQAEKIADRQARIMNNEVPSDYYDTPYWSTMWRSSIIPGWGQDYIDDARWKFYVYPLVLLGAGAAYASGYQDFLSARNTYNATVQQSFLINTIQPSETLFFINNQNAITQYNSAKRKLNQIQLGAGVIGLFAIYNLVDAYLSVRRNVVYYDHDREMDISIPGSNWKVGANSKIRSSAEWEHSALETYTNLEIHLRF